MSIPLRRKAIPGYSTDDMTSTGTILGYVLNALHVQNFLVDLCHGAVRVLSH
jgi:hypothetical protein